MPGSCCAGCLGFGCAGVDRVLGLWPSGSNSLELGIMFVEAGVVEDN